MGVINVLSFEVANLIAAGEVVDRPCSVIKELVENSIDAGATRITVEIQHGGILFMRVSDNGCGIQPDDLPVAVKRHATSKIKDADDLEAIMTLGFRGEALAAICAVSDVRIISRTEGAQLGAMLEINSGRVGELTEQGAGKGTTVIVENLFANVPARLKFLKRDQTEASAVGGTVEKIAMSHPEIAFRFISDGSCKLDTPGDGKLAGAVRAVYGKDFASKMLPVSCESGGVRAYGYITAPDIPRSSRNQQNFFINGRYVKTKTGTAALEQAYLSYIPPEKFPGCVICLQIMPEAVDVNVHPSKLEVKFSNEKPVFDAIYRAVRDTLLKNTERPGETGQKDRISAAEYAAMANGDADRKQPAVTGGTLSGLRRPQVSNAFAPVNDRAAGDFRPEQLKITGDTPGGVQIPVHTEVPAVTEKNENESGKTYENVYPEAACPAVTGEDTPKKYMPAADENRTEAVQRNVYAQPGCNPEGREEQPETAQASAQNTPCTEIPADDKGPYRIVGEAFNSYIIAERCDEVLVIDKHAAHERIIFEQLRTAMKKLDRPSVLMAVPVQLTLGSEELAALEGCRGEIESVGFGFETDGNTLNINAIPADIPADAAAAMMETFASDILSGTGNPSLTRESLFERALFQASCKAAIKAGRVYPEGYDEWIVNRLRLQPEIVCCPHGRPVAFVYTKNEIDRKFKRT